MGRAAMVIASLVLAGCYASFEGPSLDDAPAAVQQREALPSCGRTVSGYVGVASDAGAEACFWDAYQRGTPAEYQSFFFSDAGESIWIYRVRPGTHAVDVEIFGTGPGGWTHQYCSGLESTAGDPNFIGPGFVTVGCTEEPLPG